jgi:hypothetical protein
MAETGEVQGDANDQEPGDPIAAMPVEALR